MDYEQRTNCDRWLGDAVSRDESQRMKTLRQESRGSLGQAAGVKTSQVACRRNPNKTVIYREQTHECLGTHGRGRYLAEAQGHLSLQKDEGVSL